MPHYSADDCMHMASALRLAARGRYSAHPNPMVGCVLVKNGRSIADGWHQQTGKAHAEIHALGKAGEQARGATAYVTLEPCAHHGKTPPCADALVEAGVARVVVAMRDPHAVVAGSGIEKLQAAGIDVSVGLMKLAAADLIAGFLSRVTKKRPLVRVKLASSLDGAIAMDSGESQWITGSHARADVQRLRAEAGAVMTGIGTVLADDPSLNVRAGALDTRGLQPLRVVLDRQLRMPLSAGMLALPGKTLICCTAPDGVSRDTQALQRAGAEVQEFRKFDGQVDADDVLAELATRGVNIVLVEAGPTLAGHLLQRNLVDELVIYQAPHIMGSRTIGLFETGAWSSLADRMPLTITDVRRVGQDTKITARPERRD